MKMAEIEERNSCYTAIFPTFQLVGFVKLTKTRGVEKSGGVNCQITVGLESRCIHSSTKKKGVKRAKKSLTLYTSTHTVRHGLYLFSAEWTPGLRKTVLEKCARQRVVLVIE